MKSRDFFKYFMELTDIIISSHPQTIALDGIIVVVKKTFRLRNAFFATTLIPPSFYRKIIMTIGRSKNIGDMRPMKKIAQTFIILIVFFMIFATRGRADIVYMKSEDKLYGTLQNTSFLIQTSYGKVFIKYVFFKSMEYKDEPIRHWMIETINNDHFSGSLLNEPIRFRLENGYEKSIKKEQIKRMKRDIRGPSQHVTTTIFTMKNGDRFSGMLLNSRFEICTDYITKSIQAAEINRVEFVQAKPSTAKILLENGDLLEGTLKQNQISILPMAGSELSVASTDLQSIQFNAPKLVLREHNGSLRAMKDSDAETETSGPIGHEPGGHNISAFAFSDIQFDFDGFEIKPRYCLVLDEVAEMISQDSKIKIKILGHTDSVGADGYNQILSEKRANGVKNYLLRKGIDKSRLIPVGFGEQRSKASNATEDGRALNRRVELIVQNPDDRL
jgi:outer membrane protein OmpA-like peptidoglycan-associated protein